MADRTSIEWTRGPDGSAGATWNPIRARNRATGAVGWHCEHVSPGCANCYAGGINEHRFGTRLPYKPGHRTDIEIFVDEQVLLQPLRWRRPRRIFVCSMTDLFADFVSDAMLDRLFAVMALAPQHTFQVLTKRSDRMRAYFEARQEGDPWAEAADEIADLRRMEEHPAVLEPRDIPLRHIWLGVSAEDQQRADERVPDLLATPAVVRFVSAEPLIAPIDFTRCGRNELGLQGDALRWPGFSGPTRSFGPRLDWIIVGGENGPRPMHPAWARSIRDQCAAAGVAFHFKQWGQYGTSSFDMSTGLPVFREFSSFQQWVNKASTWVRGGICLDRLGRRLDRGADFMRARDENAFPVTIMDRVGKKAAGRLLDGVEHNGMPEARA